MATSLVQNELCVGGLPLLRSYRHLCSIRTAMLAIAPRLSGSANVGTARPTLRRWEIRRGQLGVVRAAGDDEPATEVDVSIFRFTLGIPGFDDTDLPRLVGFFFGSLIILNHAVSLESMTGAQLRSEAFGLFLASVAITLPFVGRRLKGGDAESDGSKVTGRNSIFSLSDALAKNQKQELAWGSYALLRNTKTSAVIVWYNGEVLCARGSWEVGSAKSLELLLDNLKKTPLMESSAPLYISNSADTKGWALVPEDAKSLLVQPFPASSDVNHAGGVILISYQPRGYSNKDRTWVAMLARKFSEILR